MDVDGPNGPLIALLCSLSLPHHVLSHRPIIDSSHRAALSTGCQSSRRSHRLQPRCLVASARLLASSFLAAAKTPSTTRHRRALTLLSRWPRCFFLFFLFFRVFSQSCTHAPPPSIQSVFFPRSEWGRTSKSARLPWASVAAPSQTLPMVDGGWGVLQDPNITWIGHHLGFRAFGLAAGRF